MIAFDCVSQRTTCGCGRAGNAAEHNTKKSSWHRIVRLWFLMTPFYHN